MNRSFRTSARSYSLSEWQQPVILALALLVAAPWLAFMLLLHPPEIIMSSSASNILQALIHQQETYAFGFTSNTGTITGKVTDEKAESLTGVTVVVVGTTRGSVTGPDGLYTITGVPLGTFTLRFSHIGYATVETTGVVNEADSTISVNATLLTSSVEMKACVIAADPVRIKATTSQSTASYMSISKHSMFKTIEPENYYREGYSNIAENEFKDALSNPLSTFSIDVDAASYSNVRRMINDGYLPPPDAVRIEEMVNYFTYDYESPEGSVPFAVTSELSECPWNSENKLLLIGLQGKEISVKKLPPSNLVFLIDVSGSMKSPDKLPLVKDAFRLLVETLREQDRISIVVYAGSSGLILPSTSGAHKGTILNAIGRLEAGGSTAGGAGISLAYAVAKENFLKNGNNRVILATDGDFNVGVSSDGELVRLIEEKRKEGVYLSVLGFGTGNYQDSKMQQLADKGNGNHYYIDNILEAKKVLVGQMAGTLFTIAKDVKIQIEFNPVNVKAYRLVGYENRMLAREDFNDDTKDAGELGAGHTVTALYEIVTVDGTVELPDVDSLKYQHSHLTKQSVRSNELLTLKLRYKFPNDTTSRLIVRAIKNEFDDLEETSRNLRFASAVAEFGLLLRDSKFKGNASYTHALNIARKAKGKDTEGYRAEFIHLVESANLMRRQDN